MTKRMIIMLTIVVVLFGGLFALKFVIGKGMQEFFDNMQQPPVTITTARAERATWPNELTAVGTIVAVNGINVTTEVAGQVKSIAFESGAQVKAGQVLVQLDVSSESASLENLRAQSKLSETSLKRIERLYKLDTLSKSDLEQAQATHDSAQAQVRAQQAMIDKKTIRAPFDGELGIRRINLGEYLDPGTAIVPLQSLDPVYVDFTMPERYLSQLQAGYEVTVRIDAFEDMSFTGKIVAIEPQVDVSTRNFKLRARLPNPDGRLRPGAFADVAVTLPGQNQVIELPKNAIAYSPYGNTVYIVQATSGQSAGEGDDSVPEDVFTVRERFVKTGEARGDFIAVTDGLEGGEEVAATGLFRLHSGSAVKIDNSDKPEPTLTPDPADS